MSNPVVEKRGSRSGSGRGSSYDGPLVMSAEVYALLEPVHHLLAKVSNPFVVREIAREVTRQLEDGTAPDRLYQQLTTRCASATVSEIRDAGRWLLGVALPRWGCGLQDCEAGVIWRTGARCEVCAEIVQDKAAARQRANRAARGLCPEHGTRSGPAGHCADCELDAAIGRPTQVPVQQTPEGPPCGACGECGVWIYMIGHALTDGLCKPCREDFRPLTAPAPRLADAPAPYKTITVPEPPTAISPRTCIGREKPLRAPGDRRGGGLMTNVPPPTGVALARQALAAAREAAKKNGATTKKPKRRSGTTVRRDGREPLGLGAAIGMMMAERGLGSV
ncbi:hypothetical protein [Streptomyces sp. CB01580]|uniref:hypothetical protein n=1 Tax=Streptomyces sp. CB01580 TaxID=1703933 RepID=UPI000AFAB95E|nr:hypothetical protein [Streptomyces sp. CB01580]